MQTRVDQAFNRCELLAKLVEWERQRAAANPFDERYIALGIIKRGEKMRKLETLKSIHATFDEIAALVEHLTILDMAASLEHLFQSRIATAAGEARKTLRSNYNSSVLAAQPKIVREADDFKSLAEIVRILSENLSKETQEKINKVRENRNIFAHGTNIRVAPTILKEDARAALNEAVELLKPV